MFENSRQASEIILQKTQEILQKRKAVIIAIDGRCGAGKTTLAACLKDLCICNVIPMDHFFLRPEQRTKERLLLPGGNVDYERVEEEVLIPLTKGEGVSYRPYSCKEQRLTEERQIHPAQITIIEGSYSCHPNLQSYYDLKIFLTVEEKEQLRRIEKRNGKDGLSVFVQKWIPLEETYFSVFNIRENSDICFWM